VVVGWKHEGSARQTSHQPQKQEPADDPHPLIETHLDREHGQILRLCTKRPSPAQADWPQPRWNDASGRVAEECHYNSVRHNPLSLSDLAFSNSL
jgi:hypothetical protein